MSEFDEKLNALLSDPDRMAQIMQLAQTLSGGASDPGQPEPQRSAERPPQTAPPPFQAAQTPPPSDLFSSLAGSLDPKLLIRLLPLVQELGSDSSSGARALLYALRPYLKAERQDRVERALQLAKLLHIGKKFFKEWEGYGV